MSISIIIPCLNEADVISETLAALQPLRKRGTEVIVVDGGSTDETVALAQPHADLVLASPAGRAVQMNAGAARAAGSILLFLHADSVPPPAADALIVDGLNRARRSWGRFDARIAGAHPLLRVVETLMNLRSRWTGIATGDQGIFVTASLFIAVDRYPEIALMEDLALTSRLKRFGAPLCLRHRITTSARRWERDGVVRTTLLMWWLRLAYWLGADPNRLATRYHVNRTGQAAHASTRVVAADHAAAAPHPSGRPAEPVAQATAIAGERPDCAVIVFAKAPIAGAVKTRLIPLLGAEGAAALHARLVEHALATAQAAAIGPVELACAPDPDHPFFRYCGERYGAMLTRQGDGDLGARMLEACNRAFARGGRVLLIGADSPALTAAHLHEARGALADGREAVVAPAEDGGYVLIGVIRCDARLFEGIAWGGSAVMAETRNRLDALGWNWHELATLWDVDRPADYERLMASGLLNPHQPLSPD
jgi:rSAM/selenodomain-associated transferase 2/rSAM/selenodomain-associated transferase 1